MERVLHDTGNFEIAHYPSLASGKLVIVFIGAGNVQFEGRNLEEFKNTLAPHKCGMVFVADIMRSWYNYADISDTFDVMSKIASQYEHVGSLGQSMGGCGAILSSKYIPAVSRVLSMSPQFSVRPPFVRFDEHSWWGDDKVGQEFTRNFSETPIKESCQLIYGNLSWQDCIHQSMYSACGFDTLNIDGAWHNVADFLKLQTPNRLQSLIARFIDFTRPFDRDAIVQELGDLATSNRLQEAFRSLRSIHDDKGHDA